NSPSIPVPPSRPNRCNRSPPNRARSEVQRVRSRPATAIGNSTVDARIFELVALGDRVRGLRSLGGAAGLDIESRSRDVDRAMKTLSEQGVDSGVRERLRIRRGGFSEPTAGRAPGNVQANLVILPSVLAHDFLRFTQANPKPCPLLAVSEPGEPRLPSLGEDL